MYILKSLRRGIYFEIQYEEVVYVYMLIRYCMLNILSNMDKNRDVTFGIKACRTLGDLRVMGWIVCS